MESTQERNGGGDVAPRPPIPPVHGRDPGPEEHPERFLDFVRPQRVPIVVEETELLIEDEEPAEQQLVRLVLPHAPEVQDVELLPVPVTVEVPVGVVEDDALPVLGQELRPGPGRRGADRLRERRAVLEDEPVGAELLLPPLPRPGLGTRALVPLVDEDEVRAPQRLERDAEPLARCRLRELVDLDDPHVGPEEPPLQHRRGVVHQVGRMDPAQPQSSRCWSESPSLGVIGRSHRIPAGHPPAAPAPPGAGRGAGSARPARG